AVHHIPQRRNHSEGAGAIPERCALEADVLQWLLSRELTHDSLGVFEEQVAGAGEHAPAEDYHLRVEDVHVIGERHTQVEPGLIEQAARILVPGSGSVRDLVGVQLSLLAKNVGKARRFPAFDQLLRTPREPRTGGDRLQTAALAAEAARAVEPDDHVAQLPRGAAHTVIDLALDDDATAYPCAYREIDEEARIPAGAETVLPERRCVRVVLEQRRDAQPLAHDLDEDVAVEIRDDRSQLRTAEVDRAVEVRHGANCKTGRAQERTKARAPLKGSKSDDLFN